MSKIKLPDRLYYPIPEAAEFLGCSIRDVYHFGATGMLKFKIYIEEITKDNVEFISLDLGGCHEGPDDSGIIDIHTELYSLYNVHYEDSKLQLLTTDSISGFFSLPEWSCILLEFSNDDFIKIHRIETEEGKDGFGVSILFDDYIEVPRTCLCIFFEDIENIKQASSMSIENTREPTRTLNRKGEIIPSLLAMIPEFNGCNIETEPVSKIINILDATAMSKGIDISIPDKNTMAKYLGRR